MMDEPGLSTSGICSICNSLYIRDSGRITAGCNCMRGFLNRAVDADRPPQSADNQAVTDAAMMRPIYSVLDAEQPINVNVGLARVFTPMTDYDADGVPNRFEPRLNAYAREYVHHPPQHWPTPFLGNMGTGNVEPPASVMHDVVCLPIYEPRLIYSQTDQQRNVPGYLPRRPSYMYAQVVNTHAGNTAPTQNVYSPTLIHQARAQLLNMRYENLMQFMDPMDVYQTLLQYYAVDYPQFEEIIYDVPIQNPAFNPNLNVDYMQFNEYAVDFNSIPNYGNNTPENAPANSGNNLQAIPMPRVDNDTDVEMKMPSDGKKPHKANSDAGIKNIPMEDEAVGGEMPYNHPRSAEDGKGHGASACEQTGARSRKKLGIRKTPNNHPGPPEGSYGMHVDWDASAREETRARSRQQQAVRETPNNHPRSPEGSYGMHVDWDARAREETRARSRQQQEFWPMPDDPPGPTDWQLRMHVDLDTLEWKETRPRSRKQQSPMRYDREIGMGVWEVIHVWLDHLMNIEPNIKYFEPRYGLVESQSGNKSNYYIGNRIYLYGSFLDYAVWYARMQVLLYNTVEAVGYVVTKAYVITRSNDLRMHDGTNKPPFLFMVKLTEKYLTEYDGSPTHNVFIKITVTEGCSIPIEYMTTIYDIFVRLLDVSLELSADQTDMFGDFGYVDKEDRPSPAPLTDPESSLYLAPYDQCYVNDLGHVLFYLSCEERAVAELCARVLGDYPASQAHPLGRNPWNSPRYDYDF